jgi:hypothetical protein
VKELSTAAGSGRNGPTWAFAFLVSAVVFGMDGPARGEIPRSSWVTAHCDFVAKFGAVPFCALENIVVLSPTIDIQVRLATDDPLDFIEACIQRGGFQRVTGRDQRWNVFNSQIWESKVGGQYIIPNVLICERPEVSGRRFSAVFPSNGHRPRLNALIAVVEMSGPDYRFRKDKSSVSINQGMAAQPHLATSGVSGDTSENKGEQDGNKTKTSEPRLGSSPPDSIFGSCSHAALFAQISSIVILGLVATYLVIIGLSEWRLGSRRRRGCCLLLLGYGWGPGIVLCVAYAG